MSIQAFSCCCRSSAGYEEAGAAIATSHACEAERAICNCLCEAMLPLRSALAQSWSHLESIRRTGKSLFCSTVHEAGGSDPWPHGRGRCFASMAWATIADIGSPSSKQ